MKAKGKIMNIRKDRENRPSKGKAGARTFSAPGSRSGAGGKLLAIGAILVSCLGVAMYFADRFEGTAILQTYGVVAPCTVAAFAVYAVIRKH